MRCGRCDRGEVSVAGGIRLERTGEERGHDGVGHGGREGWGRQEPKDSEAIQTGRPEGRMQKTIN